MQGSEVLMQALAQPLSQHPAEILHVSRTFLLKEIDEGRLSCRKVGSHRRIRAKDLMTYKADSEAVRLKAIQEMTRLSQEIEEEDE